MKSLTRMIIVLVIVNLTIGNFALAQNTSNEGNAEPVEPMQPRAVPPVATPVEPTPPTTSVPRMLTLSGKTGLSGGEAIIGVSGVEMQGLPGNPVTDENGFYSVTVPQGFSGTVIPVKKGYRFAPPNKSFLNVKKNLYVCFTAIRLGPAPLEPVSAIPGMVTISGRAFINNIVMTGLPGNPVTDQLGYYTAKVPLNWTGVVKPKKNGFIFKPAERFYNRIKSNITKENYLPTAAVPVPVFNQAGSREVLVIPSTDIGAENLLSITEDLKVMSHIFDEKFKEPQEVQGVFIDFGDIFGRDSRSTEAIYLQGYGVLFLMEVNFTFTTAPKAKEQEGQETEDVDPIWQRARRKMFSPSSYGYGEYAPKAQYSADKIDQLKTELIRTLKHTANIRNLQPDEWIILTVIGQARQSGGMFEDYYRSAAAPRSGTSRSRGRSSSSSRGSYGGMVMGGMGGGMGGMAGGSMSGGVMMGGGMGMGMGAMYSEDYSGTSPASTTVLTIRVKKSDVDAFARGFRKFEEFQKTVDIFTY